jgi:hypothetical protein
LANLDVRRFAFGDFTAEFEHRIVEHLKHHRADANKISGRDAPFGDRSIERGADQRSPQRGVGCAERCLRGVDFGDRGFLRRHRLIIIGR